MAYPSRRRSAAAARVVLGVAFTLVGLLLEHPEVMNRPVCVRGDRAVLARPAEKVNEILD